MITKLKNYISNSKEFILGNGDYKFISNENMPLGKYSSKTISNIESVDWITTGYTNDLAKNHCGATAVTNLAIYYDKMGYEMLKINDSKLETFKEIHKIIGNGPVLTIAQGAKKYFKARGYDLSKSSLNSFDEIKIAIDNNQIIGILLSNGIFDWHWVLAIGYREYENGENYLRIINGWNNTSDIFYKINSGALLFSATRYWID